MQQSGRKFRAQALKLDPVKGLGLGRIECNPKGVGSHRNCIPRTSQAARLLQYAAAAPRKLQGVVGAVERKDASDQ